MNLQEWGGKIKERLLGFGWREWGTLLLVGVCCLILVIPAEGEKKEVEVKEKQSFQEPETVESENDYVERMELRLSELLSSVRDVGKVKVMITVAGTTEKEILKDGTQEQEESTEQDSAGGSRTSVSTRSDKTTVFADTTPYVLSETYPEITGVVVLAEGSGKGTVDLDILNAVQVLFDVPAHKIRIMKMK